MNNGEIRIHRIRLGDLEDYLRSILDEDPSRGVIPISRLRARSQTINPCADESDTALLVATCGDERVGYIGLLPGQLRIGDSLRKVYWYSTWYVSEEYRHTGVGAMLMFASLSLGYDLMATELAPEVLPLYRSLPFRRIEPLRYRVLQMSRFDLATAPWTIARYVLRKQAHRLGLLNRLFLAIRRSSKALLYLLLARHREIAAEGLQFKEVDDIPADAFVSNEGARDRIHFERDQACIRSMIENPWVTDEVEKATPNYYFSDYRPLFRYIVLEVSLASTGAAAGCIVLSVSRDRDETTVKVLDDFVRQEDRPRILFAAALTVATRHQCDKIIVPEVCWEALRESRMLRALFRSVQREYYGRMRSGHDRADDVLARIELSYSDGDSAFT